MPNALNKFRSNRYRYLVYPLAVVAAGVLAYVGWIQEIQPEVGSRLSCADMLARSGAPGSKSSPSSVKATSPAEAAAEVVVKPAARAATSSSPATLRGRTVELVEPCGRPTHVMRRRGAVEPVHSGRGTAEGCHAVRGPVGFHPGWRSVESGGAYGSVRAKMGAAVPGAVVAGNVSYLGKHSHGQHGLRLRGEHVLLLLRELFSGRREEVAKSPSDL